MARFTLLIRPALLIVALVLGQCFASPSSAQLPGMRTPLESPVARVDPCVVTIKVDAGEGSGFLVDAKGLIVTNYHVIEGAKTATVVLADKKTLPVEGFVAINQGKDLALLRVQAGATPLPSLLVSQQTPARGERVFAFGAPMGLSGSVTDGIVAAVRSGAEVADTLRKLAHRDVYRESLHYDLDAQWVQSTAPISPGNSGGPLVNAQGEVVGVNTWLWTAVGQNLNFSLSAIHVRELMQSGGDAVKPLSSLPAPRPGWESRRRGDVDQTLALWMDLSKLNYEYSQKVAEQYKKLRPIVPIDPGNPKRGQNTRDRKKAVIYDRVAEVYDEYAGRVKSLDTTAVDPDLLYLTIVEADLAQRIADVCKEMAGALTGHADDDIAKNQTKLDAFKDTSNDLRTIRDLLRIRLNQKYNRKFPSTWEIVNGVALSPERTVVRERKSPGASAAATMSETPSQDRSPETVVQPSERRPRPTPIARPGPQMGFRIWTDRSGRFKVNARYVGQVGDDVRLQEIDGAYLRIQLSELSEADQKFIAELP